MNTLLVTLSSSCMKTSSCDHGESLSTAEGYADTSVGPIFVAAGAGIKEGYEMQLFPREVDVTPTAAVLLGMLNSSSV